MRVLRLRADLASPTALGAVLALAAAVLAAVQWPRQWHALEQARADLAARARQVPAATASRAGPALPGSPALDAFEPASQRTRRQSALLELLRQHGLGEIRADFRPGEASDGPMEQVTVQIGVTGPMAGLRGWLSDAMQADPGLALEALRLTRDRADSPLVRAELRLVLLSRRGRAP